MGFGRSFATSIFVLFFVNLEKIACARKVVSQIHFQPFNMRNTLLLLAAAASSSAATISFNNTATASGLNSYSNLTLSQFDSALGELTGVTVTVNSLSYGGSFFVTSGPSSQNELDSADGRATLRQAVGSGLGFTQIGERTDAVTTTPGVGTTFSFGDSQTFFVSALTVVSDDSQTIGSGFWSAYTGTGSVTFQVKNRPDIAISGGVFTLDSELFTVTADMTVTYEYTPTPVPEASTYGLILGGLALAGAAVRRRKQLAK